jgi:hypothetical protein
VIHDGVIHDRVNGFRKRVGGLGLPLFLLVVAGCGGVPADRVADTFNESTGQDSARESLIVSISLQEISGAPLAREVQLELHEPAAIRLEFWQEDGQHFERRFPAGALTQDLSLIGLRASQESHLVVHADTSELSESSPVFDFETGALDFELPLNLGDFAETPSDGKMAVFGFDALGNPDAIQFVGVDRSGEIVWAYRDDVTTKTKGVPLEVIGGDQFFHITLNGGVFVDAFGRVVNEITSSESVHHDAALLPSGNVALIVRNKKQVETDAWGPIWVRAGALAELDTAGQVVWRWDPLDHLDLSTIPMPNNGTSDWTHFNSLQSLPDSDQILVSARNQSQALLIDKTSGDIVWILGVGGDFDLLEGTWFNFQHDVTLLEDGSLLMVDNGNTKLTKENTRIVRYALDLQSMTARETLSLDLGVRIGSMGSVQLLENGNMLVSLGGQRTRGRPVAIFEINSAGQEVWRLEVPDGDSAFSVYRSQLVNFAEVVSD